MKKEYFSVLVLLLLLLFYSHSNGNQNSFFAPNAKKDYEKIVKLQQETEQSFLETHDFDIKIKGCENVILALNEFLKNYPNDKHNVTFTPDLESWKTKKFAFTSEQNMLINKLSSLLGKKAGETAQKKHPMSKIEAIDLASQDKHTVGEKLNLTNVYSVRMKGKMLGKSIFKLSITTSGSIDTEDKSVLVNDKAQVEE
jgi:hypothetical protein